MKTPTATTVTMSAPSKRKFSAAHCRTANCSGTIALKAKAPVLQTPKPVAVAAPTEKRGFITPKFRGLVRLHLPIMVSGGLGKRATCAARLQACLKHPAHLLRVQTQMVALDTPVGAKTMTAVTTASRCAAPALPHLDPIALHGEAVNAAAMARWYAARHDYAAAFRRSAQATGALRKLAAFECQGVAA